MKKGFAILAAAIALPSISWADHYYPEPDPEPSRYYFSDFSLVNDVTWTAPEPVAHTSGYVDSVDGVLYTGNIALQFEGWEDSDIAGTWSADIAINLNDGSMSADNTQCASDVDFFCDMFLADGQSTSDVTDDRTSPYTEIEFINGGVSGFVIDWHTTDPVSNVGTYSFSEVPLPAGVWLFGSALLGLGASRQIKRRANS